jgi:hypothetical protein
MLTKKHLPVHEPALPAIRNGKVHEADLASAPDLNKANETYNRYLLLMHGFLNADETETPYPA